MKLYLLHLVNFIIILLIIIIIDDADDRTIQSIESITTSNTESREDSSITTHTRSSAFVSSIPDDIAMDSKKLYSSAATWKVSFQTIRKCQQVLSI